MCCSKIWHNDIISSYQEVYIIWGQFWNSEMFLWISFCRCCIAKYAVSPSTSFALNQRTAPLRRTRKTGAVVAASFVTCVAGKTSTQRYGLLFWLVLLYLFISVNVVQPVSITISMSPSAIVGVWTMPELLSFFLSGTQLSKTKQEEESLGRFTSSCVCYKHAEVGKQWLLVLMCWFLCRFVWHASGVKVVVSHRGRVGTLTGTMTKDSVQTVQSSMNWVRGELMNDLSPPLLTTNITDPCEANLSWMLFPLGNYCPICFKCYEDNDYDSQMMQCGTCNHWVHAKCEDLTGEFFIFLKMKVP